METTDNVTGSVEQLDHFAIPAMNLDRAERFYSDVLGAKTVTKKDYEGSTFMKFGPHHFVLFSQDKATIPEREKLDSYPRCSFVLPPGEYDRVVSQLRQSSARVDQLGKETRSEHSGLRQGIVFTDSEGNLLEVFTGEAAEPTRLHHLHFDTTNLHESIEFYTKLLNLDLAERLTGIAVLKIPTGQAIILHQVNELSEVTKTAYRGRHFALYVTDDNFHAIRAKLRQAGVKEQSAERDKHGPRDARGDGQLSMYFLEPSGFRLEIVNQDSVYFARKYNFPI